MNPTTFAWAYLLILLVAAGFVLFVLHVQAVWVMAVCAIGFLPVFPIVKTLRERHR